MPKIPFPSETGPRLSSVGYMEKYTSPLEVDPAPKVESEPETGTSSGAFNVPDMLRGFGTMVSDLNLREKIASIDWKEKIKTAGVGVGVGFAARAGLAAVFGPSYLIGIAGGAAGGIARSLYVERKKIIQDAVQYKIVDITAQLDQNDSEPVALAAVMVKARQLIADGRYFVEDKAAIAALEEKLTVVQQKLEAPEAAVDKKQQLEYILSQLKGKQKVRVGKLQAGDAKKILESVVFEHETREIVDKKSRYLKAAGKGALIGALGFMAADKVIELGKDIFFADAGAVIPDTKPAAKVAVGAVADTTRQAKEQVLAELHKSSPSVRVSQGGSVYGAIREMTHNRLVVEGKFSDGLSSAANNVPEKYLPAFQEYVADAVIKRHKEAITIIREGKSIIWDGDPSSILSADRIQVPDSVLSEAITQAKQKLATPQLERLTEAYISQVKPEVVAGLKADQFIGSSPKIGDEALSAWWTGKQEALQNALQKIKEVAPPEAVPQSEDLVSPETWETLKWASKAAIIPVTLAAAAYGVHVFRKKGTAPEVKDASAVDEEADAQKQAEIELLQQEEQRQNINPYLGQTAVQEPHRTVPDISVQTLHEEVVVGQAVPQIVEEEKSTEAESKSEIEKKEKTSFLDWRKAHVAIAHETDVQELQAKRILDGLAGFRDIYFGKPKGLEKISFQIDKLTPDQFNDPDVLTGTHIIVSFEELAGKSPEEQRKKMEGFIQRAYANRVMEAVPELKALGDSGAHFRLNAELARQIFNIPTFKTKFIAKATELLNLHADKAANPRRPLMFKLKGKNNTIELTSFGEPGNIIAKEAIN